MERRSKKGHDSSKGKGIQINEPIPQEEHEEEEEVQVPPPTSIVFKFSSPQNEARFSFLEKKTIKTGAEIRIHEIGQFGLLPLFQRQRWEPILHIQATTYKTITHMFYANLEVQGDDDTKFITMVQGKSITITPKIIGRVLGIPYKGVDVYGHTLSTFPHYPEGHDKHTASKLLHGSTNLVSDTKAATLVPRARVLASILGFTVYPKSGGRDRITSQHKLLTYCVLAGIKVNLPLMILHFMIHLSTSIGSLYYGNIITMLVKSFGIDPTIDYAIVNQDKYFGHYNIKLMKFDEAPSVAHPESTDEEASPPHPPPPQAPTYTTDFQDRIFNRLDIIERKIDFDAAYTQYHFNYFYDISGYPPPPPFEFPPPQTGQRIPTPPPSPPHSPAGDDE